MKKIKEEIQNEKEYLASIQKKQEEAATSGNARLMTEEERNELRNALKARWAEIHKKYQKILLPIDKTAILRKENYEAEMDALEKEIEKLSRKFIFVVDDQ